MYDGSNLSKIEEHCNEVMNSPYLLKEVPPELKNLRTVLEKIEVLIKEDVPSLITEVKQLRNQNRRLEAEIETLRKSQTEDSAVSQG